MPKPFRNLIPGNEMAPVAEAVLTPEELSQKIENQAARSEITRLNEELVVARSKLASLQGQCKHHVFIDIPGIPYSTRQCYICDAYMGYV